MKIALVSPASPLPGVVTGNDVTAERWEAIFRALGNDVLRTERYRGEPADLLVALHARKSALSVESFSKRFPDRPIVVVLTGTDLYGDLPDNEQARASLDRASHVVALQPGALDVLEPEARRKTTIIYQSARPTPPVSKAANCFQVCLVAHLREVKDPFVAAEAAVRLPRESHVQIVHAGDAFSEAMRRRAKTLSSTSSRYRWIGPVSHEEARLLIARSHLLLLTSRSEGGANVLSEALAARVPILASRVPGVEGLLGASYPGFFPAGDVSGLTALLMRAERDDLFYRRLGTACAELSALVAPALEKNSWALLLSSCS